MARDLYEHFRIEAREIQEALSHDAIALEQRSQGPAAAEVLARMRRSAHTLKGAARVVRQNRIADLAHAIEDALRTDASGTLGASALGDLLVSIDAIGAAVGALDGPPAAHAASDAFVDTVRVEVAQMDDVMQSIAEAGVQLTASRRAVATLRDARVLSSFLAAQFASPGGTAAPGSVARSRALSEELDGLLTGLLRALPESLRAVERELLQARNAADRLRLVSVRTIFPMLETAAHDAGRASAGNFELHMTGGDVRLDAQVLAGVRDALAHVVRNAVVHGIEPASERVSAGKSPIGRIELHVRRHGHRVAFVCRDDGRGFDVDAIRRAAVERGLVAASDAAALPDADAAMLALGAGLSTRADVDQVAGRGVGLDIVREAVARLRGEVALRSERGRGAEVEIRLPVSLLSVQMLLVRSGEDVTAVPLDAVVRTLCFDRGMIAVAAQGSKILLDDVAIPYVPLAWMLGRDGAKTDATRFVVIVRAGNSRVAVGVDQLVGTGIEIVRPVPPSAAATDVIAGASLDAEGIPRLVLDPAGLVRAASRVQRPIALASSKPRTPVLIVDDSLTTRLLEQSILETAGYEVELASSGEEGLRKARTGKYKLFLVDVEMPGIDGYEFVRTVRADPELREIPAVLVTSRNADEDIRRGTEAGARGYLVKGEFEQGRLLRLIEQVLA